MYYPALGSRVRKKRKEKSNNDLLNQMEVPEDAGCTASWEVRQSEKGAVCIQVMLDAQFENNHLTEMCSGSEESSYVRRIGLCITQL